MYIWYRFVFCVYQFYLSPNIFKQKGEAPYNNKYSFNERKKNNSALETAFLLRTFEFLW